MTTDQILLCFVVALWVPGIVFRHLWRARALRYEIALRAIRGWQNGPAARVSADIAAAALRYEGRQ